MLFGMYFVTYIKKVNYKIAFASAGILILNTVFTPSWNSTIQTTYIGISSFLLLVILSKYVEKYIPIQNICSIIGKYSYAIFLVHHVVIQEITKSFNMESINKTNSYLLFILCCVIIALLSKGLFTLDKVMEREVLK